MGFYIDNADSISYQQTDSAIGVGECNNIIKDIDFNPTGGWGATSSTVNKRRRNRMFNTNFNPIGGTQSIFHGASSTNCSVSVKNNVIFSPSVGAFTPANTTSIAYNVLTTIRLGEIHDPFRKLPLVKGMYMQLILNLNTLCTSTIGLDNAGTTFTNAVTSFLNGTFPAMISPLTAGNGLVVTTCASLKIVGGYW